ncbi:helix-turn-helix transcriptional regulator [Clostridium sp. 'deep sea']|uniref:helix-turn-helix domain-containing protein n=1 Tax=Clostridium sp. 'deep sea' TaxID=2779445 RepID=UPI0018965E13|nr:helix-turn-helix transcriptional regulator [Clostridium sp. 'deep sea']QOR33953.1 helix-turn-helix transcriptional regulator [Clostridium sp. 'deep sea']
MSTLSVRLKQARKHAKLTQNEVSLKTSINRATLANWEVGRTEPDTNTLSRLADLYNVSLDYLFGKTNELYSYENANSNSKQQITDMLKNDDQELLEFWNTLKEREDLFLLFKQVRGLDKDDIKRVIRIIKAIEDEEEAGNRHD